MYERIVIVLSVLSVEPYGMKLGEELRRWKRVAKLSVLSVEPYGMKHPSLWKTNGFIMTFSALGRAVWDETFCFRLRQSQPLSFQCSRSSRMG